ncbi:RidA family protein [Streptomyces noursei]|uniref:RidA family protein n=1 Tax=Streptomyces noursei TaxID=1971 RepID=UPI001E43765D|nr:RidA family protein [Streptomyces noursei]MCZ1019938.1 RidA family protein [Streptomyces noursei]
MSLGIRVGNLVVTSGRAPIDAQAATVGAGDFEAQARQALANPSTVLTNTGSRLADVVKATVFGVHAEPAGDPWKWQFRERFGDWLRWSIPATRQHPLRDLRERQLPALGHGPDVRAPAPRLCPNAPARRGTYVPLSDARLPSCNPPSRVAEHPSPPVPHAPGPT